MRLAAALAGALLLAPGLSPAGPSAARGASLFSLNGLGETIDQSNGRGRALGGVSTALDDSARVGIDNPGLLGGMTRVSFSTAFVAERRTAESATASETFTDGNFPSIVGGLPFMRFAVIGIGILREQAVFVNPLVVQNIPDPSPHSLRFRRDGDVFRIPIALGRAFGPRVSVGVSLDKWYGNIEEERIVDFTRTDFRDTHDLNTEDVRGTGWSAGIVGRPLPRAVVGLKYRAPETLRGRRVLTTGDGGASSEAVEEKMPASWAAGAQVEIVPRLQAALEVRRDLWAGEEADAPPGGGYEDATRVGGGLELFPRPGATGLANRPFRIGYRRAGWSFRDQAGNSINEWFFSGGTSFPLGGDIGVLDLFLEYGRRGSQEENGLEERIFRFGAGFAAGEHWRSPPRGRRGGVPSPKPGY